MALCESKTIEIFVNRSNVYNEAMDELLPSQPLEDISYPLEVTFIGEVAADYGGPHKEFLGCVTRALCDRLFLNVGNKQFELKEDVSSLQENHYYYGAGLLLVRTFCQVYGYFTRKTT